MNRQRTAGMAATLSLLASGAALATLAVARPDVRSDPTGWAPWLGCLIGAGVLLAAMVRRTTARSGLAAVALGWILIALPAAAAASGDRLRALLDGLGGAAIDATELAWAVQGVGTLAIVAGVGRWMFVTCAPTAVEVRSGRRSEDVIADLKARLEAATRQLAEARTLDDVTGALNRGAFVQRVQDTVNRDVRLKKPFAFLLVDVVSLGSVRDSLGQIEADHVLKAIARSMQSATRGTDVVGRLGERMFGVVLPECDDAQPAITRLLLALEDVAIPDSEAPTRKRAVPVTVHVGCVAVPDASWCRGFGQLTVLAEERLRTLRGVPRSHMAKTTLERGTIRSVAG